MPDILTIHKGLYVLLACVNLTLLGISIWTLADPVIHAFYKDMTINGHGLPNDANTWSFFVISIVSLVSSVQFITIGILALWANAKRLRLFRTVTFYNLALISFTVAGIALVATNRDTTHTSKLKSALSDIMRYKEENYYESIENSQFMDTVQKIVGCCGVVNADVYVTKKKLVPSSCGKYYGYGCLEGSLNYLNQRLVIFVGLHSVIFILQIATLFASCFVSTKTKKKSMYYWSPNSNRSRSLNSIRSRSPTSSRSRSPRSLKY